MMVLPDGFTSKNGQISFTYKDIDLGVIRYIRCGHISVFEILGLAVYCRIGTRKSLCGLIWGGNDSK